MYAAKTVARMRCPPQPEKVTSYTSTALNAYSYDWNSGSIGVAARSHVQPVGGDLDERFAPQAGPVESRQGAFTAVPVKNRT